MIFLLFGRPSVDGGRMEGVYKLTYENWEAVEQYRYKKELYSYYQDKVHSYSIYTCSLFYTTLANSKALVNIR